MRSNCNAANKETGIVYTVMMVCVMVYGMVCYNIALDVGGMQNFIFAAAPQRAAIMGVHRLPAGYLSGRPRSHTHRYGLVHPRQGQAGVPDCRISCLSAWMMCPLMSFFATLFFKDSHNANFFAIWCRPRR
ncbi:MAG: DUF2798 domain-containing protein [Oscillospiraceae bacterium]|nr:MAG: DUF2798 domain-containing protein [Oscillospiraceae bacterium]